MPEDTRRKLFDIRCRSKRGAHLAPEEIRFLSECFAKWPKQYEAMGRLVFEETAPFGSRL